MTYYSYKSAVRQRHGECLLPDRLVAWSVVPGESNSVIVKGRTLSDEQIEDIIALVAELFDVLDGHHARAVPDGEYDTCAVALCDMNVTWEPPFCDKGIINSEWLRDIFVTTRGNHAFANLSLTWPETKDDIT